MYFGDINVKDSLDCILAHTIVINKKKFSKGTGGNKCLKFSSSL